MTYLLDTDIQTRIIFLDSINGESIMEQDLSNPNLCYNSYKWYLGQPILCPPYYRMLISLIDAQFPNVFYNIRENVNNYLHILFGSTNYDIYVPTGQYNIETLCSYISSQITGLSITINYVSYTLTFSSTGSSFRIYGDSTIGSIIGLNKNSNNTYQTAISFANTLTLSGCFNLSGTPYLFVKIINQSIESLDGGNNDGSIARLDINAPYGHMCFYRPPSIENFLINSRYIEMFNIILTDHNNIPLCLRSSNIQLTFRIQYIKIPEIENLQIGTLRYELAKELITNKISNEYNNDPETNKLGL